MNIDQTNKFFTLIIGIILLSLIGGVGSLVIFMSTFESPAQAYSQTPGTSGASGYQTQSTKFSPVIIQPTATSPSAAAESGGDTLTLMGTLGCLGCHMVADQGVEGPGPHLNGLADRIGGYGIDLSPEEYVRQSIADPTAFISPACADGPCPPIMPVGLADGLSDSELDTLVSFILSLPAE